MSHLQHCGSPRAYTSVVPSPWGDTVGRHRTATHQAALEAAGALIAQYGLAGVTMARIAQRAGIGRATLYRKIAQYKIALPRSTD